MSKKQKLIEPDAQRPRPLKRAQEHIENPLSKKILDGSFGPKDIVVDADAAGHFSFRKPG